MNSKNIYEPMTTVQFIIWALVYAIPIVGFILMIVNLAKSDVNINLKNWTIATLIISIIGLVSTALFALLLLPLIWVI